MWGRLRAVRQGQIGISQRDIFHLSQMICSSKWTKGKQRQYLSLFFPVSESHIYAVCCEIIHVPFPSFHFPMISLPPSEGHGGRIEAFVNESIPPPQQTEREIIDAVKRSRALHSLINRSIIPMISGTLFSETGGSTA